MYWFEEDINKYLDERFSELQNLNYCRLLLPSRGGQISVIGKYSPCRGEGEGAKYVTLNRALATVESSDLDRYYYGVSPVVDESRIVQAISQHRFRDTPGLEGFLSEHCEEFMLRCEQREYLLPCAKLFVLSIAHNFGIKLMVEGPLYQKLLAFQSTTLVEAGGKPGEIFLCGCPTEELYAALAGSSFRKQKEGPCWVCCPPDTEGAVTVQEIYSRPENILLLHGHTFYSGALLRVLHLEEIRQSYGNDKIVPIRVHFERSSYGTVYTFDNNFTAHPLLAQCKELILRMYREDDESKRRLLRETAPGQKPGACMDAVNRYLSCSHNVNQLGVTGNIITADGILLVGVRDAEAIDAGELYPSVNGNAELMDRNVGFYKLSANEDYPTVDLGANRIDFYGELCREAYAELAVTMKENAWDCYGLTVSGIVPPQEEGKDGEYPFRKRRMHFNVLCEQCSEHGFDDFLEKQKNATEAYENRDLNGIRLVYHPNRRARFLDKLSKTVRVLTGNESYIMAVVAMCVLLATLLGNVFAQGTLSLSFSVLDVVTYVFYILSIIMLAMMARKMVKEYRHRKKYIHKICLTGRRRPEGVEAYFQRRSCHPVTYAAIMSHVLKTVRDSERQRSKEKRE